MKIINKEQFPELLKKINIPIRFIEELETMYPNKIKRPVLEKNKSSFLFGLPGTGKTLKAIAMALDNLQDERQIRPSCIFFSNVNEILFEIRQTYNKHYKFENDFFTPEETIINKYTTPKYLILDDLGVEKTTDFTNQILYLIINRRYESKLITFVTSNNSPEELQEKMEDGRIISRLMSDSILFEMTKQYRIR